MNAILSPEVVCKTCNYRMTFQCDTIQGGAFFKCEGCGREVEVQLWFKEAKE